MDKQYCWQNPMWPSFVYDEKASFHGLYRYAVDASRLTSAITLTEDRKEACIDILAKEAVCTSNLENKFFDLEDSKNCIKSVLSGKPFGANYDRDLVGISRILTEILRSFSKPLTVKRLLEWSSWIDTGSNGWRSIDASDLLPAHKIESEIERFLSWFNDRHTMPSGPVKAAIVALWVHAISPFNDKNGIIARGIAYIALAQDLNAIPVYSLSSKMESSNYIEILQKSSGLSMDASIWIDYFLKSIIESQDSEKDRVKIHLKKNKYLRNQRNFDLNDRQIKAIDWVLNSSSKSATFTSTDYSEVVQCSKSTAVRDINALISKGCIDAFNESKRNAKYSVSLKNHEIDSFFV